MTPRQYRAKRMRKDEWVYGSLVYTETNGRVSAAIVTKTRGMRGNVSHPQLPVRANTIGQYTGVTDTNGQEIYEGDIVRYTSRRNKGTQIDYNVMYNNHGCYVLKRDACEGFLTFDQAILCGTIAVVGNIHDK